MEFVLLVVGLTIVLAYIIYRIAWAALGKIEREVWGNEEPVEEEEPEEDFGQWRLVNESPMVPPDFLTGGGMDGQVTITYTEDGTTFLLDRDENGGWVVSLKESE